MRFNIFFALLVLCLLVSGHASAQPDSGKQEKLSPRHERLQEYREKEYSITGPLQITRIPFGGRVEFRRHKTVTYKSIDIIDVHGQGASVDKYDRVYILQKEGEVILIRIVREYSDAM